MEAAFRSGEIDAAVTYPPVSINILSDTKAVELFSTAEIPGEVIAVEAEVIDHNPDEVEKFLRAYLRAIDYSDPNILFPFILQFAFSGSSGRT